MSIRRRERPGADVHTLIGPYVLDAVTDIERATVERHLRACPTCAAEVTELRAAAARLGDAATTSPPPDLRARVLAQASRTRQLPPGRPDESARKPPTWARWAAGVAAAAVLLVGSAGVTSAVQQHRVDGARRDAAAARGDSDRLAAILAAPDATVVRGTPPAGNARMVMSAQRNQAVVLLSDLPGAGAGRTYQLWLVSGGTPHNVGVLAEGQSAAREFMTGVRGASSFAISLEPAGGSPAPTHLWAEMPLHA